MKKLFYWILLVLSLFAIVRDTSALSYGGNNTPSFPDIQSSTGFVYAYPQVNNTDDINSYSLDLTTTVYTSFFCFDFEATSSGVLHESVFYTVLDGYAIYPTGVTFVLEDIVDAGVEKKALFARSFINGYNDTNIPRKIDTLLVKLPAVPNSGGANPTHGVVCAYPRVAWDTAISGGQLYLYDVRYSYYNGSTGTFGFGLRSFTNSSIRGQMFFSLYDDYGPNGSRYIQNFGAGLGYNGFRTGPAYASPGTLGLYQKTEVVGSLQGSDIIEFMSSTGTTENLYSSLPVWFESTNSYSSGENFYESGSTGSGGTGTGGVDTGSYYQDCDGITDLGCYIAGFSNFIFDIPGIIFDKIIDTILGLLPDISFSGTFNSCSTEFNSEDATWTDSLKNFLAFLNPFMPPGEGEIICTVWGEEELHYSRLIPEKNFFELYLPNAPSYLTVSPYILPGQTIFDIILISVMIGMIFYKRHH